MIAEILPKIENTSKELEGEEADLENVKKVFTGQNLQFNQYSNYIVT